MESWENKIIADKLNSLQELPEDYTPNIASKWEIIQSGLQKPKPNRRKWGLMFFLGVCVALAIWTLGPSTETRQQPVSTNQTSKTTTQVQEVQSPVSKQIIKLEEKRIQRISPVSQKQPGKKDKVTQWKPHPVEVPVSLKPHLTIDTIKSVLKDTLKVSAPIAEMKRKSRKVYQKDFEGIIGNNDQYNHKTAQKSFEIKLNINKRSEPNPASTPALRLIQNF